MIPRVCIRTFCVNLAVICIGLCTFSFSDVETNNNTVRPEAFYPRCNCTHPDFEGLVALYQATNGSSWINKSGWQDGVAGLNCDVCSWHGIICQNNRVTNINLSGNNLVGFIPDEISSLTFLEQFTIANNNIHSISEQIVLLENLYLIWAGNNSISNSILDYVYLFPSLQYLELQNNNLTGSLPPTLALNSSLQGLNLWNNELEGIIPAELYEPLCLNNQYPTGEITGFNIGNNHCLYHRGNTSGLIDFCINGGLCLNPLLYIEGPVLMNQGSSITLTANEGFSYLWNTGSQSPSITVSPQISTTYSVVDDCGWVADHEVEVRPYGSGCHPDFDALVDLYHSTNGTTWFDNSGWLDDCDVCSWYGVSCSSSGRVQRLELPFNGLTGTLPFAIGDLDSLLTLDLSYNQIGGNLPHSLYNLLIPKVFIFLNDNQLTGQLPDVFPGNWGATIFDLSNNNFFGPLPISLGNTNSLFVNFNVTNNNLEGCYPSTYLNLCNKNLIFENNPCLFLGGSVDGWNQFCTTGICGSLGPEVEGPDFIWQGQSAILFATGSGPFLWSNGMTGSVIEVSPNNTSIYTVIDDCGYSTNFELIVLPVGSGCHPDYDALHAFYLAAQGSQWIQKNGWNDDCDVCNWFGVTCRPDGRVIGLELVDNNLSGYLASEIGSIPFLQWIDLSFNDLTDQIPSSLIQLSHLQSINLSYNNFVGCFPANLQPWCWNGVSYDFSENYCLYRASNFLDFCSGIPCVTYLTIDGPNTVCSGQPLQLSTDYSLHFRWLDVPLQIANDSLLTITITSSRIFEIESLCSFDVDSKYVTVLPNRSSNQSATICQGETFQFGTQQLTSSGNYTEVFMASNGCDSTVFLNLHVWPSYQTSIDVSICSGDSYTVGGVSYLQAGFYEIHLTTQQGCDSIILLNLNILPVHETNLSESICEGEPYQVGNEFFGSSGLFTISLKDQNNCDSIINLNLHVYPIHETILNEQICYGESIEVGNQIFTETGEYLITLTDQNGCDSLVQLFLTVNPKYEIYLDLEICEGQSVQIGNSVYVSTGVFKDFLTTTNGCDSIVNLNLIVHPLLTTELFEEICDGASYTVGTST